MTTRVVVLDTSDTPPAARPSLPVVLQPCLPPIVLAFLCAFLFFHGLGDRDLWSSHEGRAAQDAQSLLEDGFRVVPHLFDGRAELQKPPLYYGLVAVIARVATGQVDGWSLRLPAAFAGLGGVLGLYLFCVRRGRPVAGFVAAVVLATAIRYTWLARVGRIDMPLTFTTAVAVWGFFLAWTGSSGAGRWPWLAAAYLAVAVGLLLKGPIAAVLPVAAAVTWLLLRRDVPRPWHGRAWLRLLYGLGVWWGIPLVLLLVVPCYLRADAETGGEFSRVFLWHHNVHRGFGGSALLRAHPWWFYLPRFLVDFLPWTVALPVAVAWFFRRQAWRDDEEARFGLTWLLAIVVLLSLMRFKRADYLLPAYPGAALFLGCVAEHLWQRAARPRGLAVAFAGVAGACVLGWWAFRAIDHARYEPQREFVRFAAEVRRRAPRPEAVMLFRTEAHALAFHLGRPLSVVVEWKRLNALAAGPAPAYVVMPEPVAREAAQLVTAGRLEEVLRNTDLSGAEQHEEPLVLLRTCPGPTTP